MEAKLGIALLCHKPSPGICLPNARLRGAEGGGTARKLCGIARGRNQQAGVKAKGAVQHLEISRGSCTFELGHCDLAAAQELGRIFLPHLCMICKARIDVPQVALPERDVALLFGNESLTVPVAPEEIVKREHPANFRLVDITPLRTRKEVR